MLYLISNDMCLLHLQIHGIWSCLQIVLTFFNLKCICYMYLHTQVCVFESQNPHMCSFERVSLAAAYTRLGSPQTSRKSISTSHLAIGAVGSWNVIQQPALCGFWGAERTSHLICKHFTLLNQLPNEDCPHQSFEISFS